MPFTWIDGALHTLEISWSLLEAEFEVNSEKTVSSIDLTLAVESDADGIYYFDDIAFQVGVDVAENQGDISYITLYDHRETLPDSLQHQILTPPFLHKAVALTAASNPKDATPANRPAGVAGEIVFYSAKAYLCVNATIPTWEMIQSA